MNVSEAARQALDVARRTINGELDPLVACCAIAGLKEYLREVPSENMDFFVGICSECDDIPLGEVRRYWAPDALADRDRQAAEYRSRIRTHVVEELELLVEGLLRNLDVDRSS